MKKSKPLPTDPTDLTGSVDPTSAVDAVDAVNYATPRDLAPAPATTVPSYPGGPNYPVDPNYPVSPFGAAAFALDPGVPTLPAPRTLAILNGTKTEFNIVGARDPIHPDRYLRGPDFKQGQIQVKDRITVIDPAAILGEFICLSEGTANDGYWLRTDSSVPAAVQAAEAQSAQAVYEAQQYSQQIQEQALGTPAQDFSQTYNSVIDGYTKDGPNSNVVNLGNPKTGEQWTSGADLVGPPIAGHPGRFAKGPDFMREQIQLGVRIRRGNKNLVCKSDGSVYDAYWEEEGA